MREDRPVLVWIVSVVLGLMAVSQIVILSLPLFLDASDRLQGALASVSVLDRLALCVLAAILLKSMIALFRLRKRAIDWFVVYIGLGSAGALFYAATPQQEPHFDDLVSLGGLLVAFAVLAYMLRLSKRNKLA